MSHYIPPLRCYNCGLAPEKPEVFLSLQTDGEKHWYHLKCPQCYHSNPPLAAARASAFDVPPAHPMPTWKVRETNYGIYVGAFYPNGTSSSAPIIPEHQIFDAPASLIRPGLTGTIGQHHRFLIKRGEERSAQFKARCEEIRAERDKTQKPTECLMPFLERTKDWYQKVVDEAREACLVGDHGNGPWLDGAHIERQWVAIRGRV